MKESVSLPADEKHAVLSGEKALEDPTEDKLGYAPFAKTLAVTIQEMIPPEGIVLAIYGTWGSGKTTMLNFVVHYVRQVPKDRCPIIVHFNPWWFSGAEDLTMRFFTQLKIVLGKSPGFGKQLLGRLADLAEIVSEPTPYATAGKLAALGLRTAAKQRKDVVELRHEITDLLKNQDKRILIIIDDIDRLAADDIRQIFRVIKAVADFPNVVYLLAFDKTVVIKALEKVQDLPGEAYLEKIVQAPFELPVPARSAIRRILFGQLDMILAGTPRDLFDQTYWSNVYYDGVDHFISTPRDVVRLTNSLSVTYPAVIGEVNPSDFVAIETLRVFCPAAYDFVRKNPESFAGHTPALGGPVGGESVRLFHESWMKQIRDEDKNAVKKLLVRVFPKFETVWGNIHYPAEWESKWRRERRVCSLDVFHVYFRLAVPEGDISNAEMNAILSLVSDNNAFAAILIGLASEKRPDGTPRARVFLDRFMDYYDEIPIGAIASVIETLLEVGDRLLAPEDEPRGFLEERDEMKIGRIIWHLLPRVNEEVRFNILSDAMAGHSISMIVETATSLARQHGKYGTQARPPEQRLLTLDHAERLERIALKKIRDAAEQDALVRLPDFTSILYRWREWTGDEEVKKWVQHAVETDDGLSTIIDKCLSRVLSHTITDRVARTSYRLDASLRAFIGSDDIAHRLERLVQDGRWSEEKKLAVEQFLRERTESSIPKNV
jgi:predicted KAP-like P-loop ATPase